MDIDRLSIIESLETYIQQDKPTIDFDTIYPPCKILNVLQLKDIMDMNYIAKDRTLSGKPKEKQRLIKQIMMNRGFKKLAAGTNRLVFKYMEDQSFVIKVPFNAVGLRDNLDESYNQYLIKPFCTKVFEVSPCGTVGMFERVHGITNREEFQLLSSTIFDIIINRFIGQFVLADFGTKFFMNWGIRKNTYPVLLDFPYLYELDGAKLSCNRPDSLSEHGFCGGEIDYDNGFNHLVCKKCGKTYLASELRLSENKKNKSILIEREDIGMIVTISKGDKVIHRCDTTKESDTYRRDKKGRKKETPLEYRERRKCKGFKAAIVKRSAEEHELDITSKQEPNTNIDEFNNNYSLDSIPTDIDQVYKCDASISVTQSMDKKNKINKPVTKQDIKNTAEDIGQAKELSERTEESIVTVKQELEVEVAKPISKEMYEMAQQIHETNSTLEESNIEEEEPIGRDFDQDCGTNLSELLQDTLNETPLEAETDVRPANKKLIIQSRNDTVSIPGGYKSIYQYNNTIKVDTDEGNHIDESYYD